MHIIRPSLFASTLPHFAGTRSQIMRTLSEIESAARGEDDSPVVALARLKEHFLGTGRVTKESTDKAEAARVI
jgi:hypothetical protein